jgi:hypothetical protein
VTTDAAAWWYRLHRHIRELWPRGALLPVFLFVAWPLYCLASGERRWEFAVSIFLGGVLPYVGPTSKRVFVGIMPIAMVGIFYDWMRFVRNVGLSPERVHVCDLRALEIRLFGVNLGDRAGTIHDLVQSSPSLPLDVFFAIPYGTFIGVAALFALFLYFVDYAAMRRFAGAFFVLNVLAFATYRIYPAAPPWYFHAHGCVADLATRASEGPNLARVDAWLGFRYFGGFYARSTNVFGAVPSLHVAYPLLAAIEGFRPFGALRRARWLKWPLRVSSVLFFLWMCVAAVYLDHHWALDLVCGCLYALVVCFAFRRLSFLAPVAGRVDVPLPAAE